MMRRQLPNSMVWFLAALMGVAVGAGLASAEDNPPQPGFNLKGSDPEAIRIADQVMEAMGGRKAWDDTRYLSWRFFGRRLHVWDKHTGRHRFEGDDLVVLWNLHSGQGKAWKGGEPITDAAALKEALDRAHSAWINDTYWMFMPYKLKDTGVTLKYVGEAEMPSGRRADVLELTFENVGRTPENRYRVYVDRETHLVGHWDYYKNASDEETSMSTPWNNWRPYGGILLSDDRGERKHTDIRVFQEMPDTVFENPAPAAIISKIPEGPG